TARYSLYRGMLRLCFRRHIKAFAMVLRKERLIDQNVHDLSWILLLQPPQRLTSNREEQVVIFHDEGEDRRIRPLAQTSQLLGHSKRAFKGAEVTAPFR